MVKKLAFHTSAFHEYTIEKTIKMLKATGYDAIELNAEKFPWLDNDPHIHINMTNDEIDSIKRLVDQHDMEISSISAHIPLINDDPKKQLEAEEFTKKCLDIAKTLNIDIAHGISGVKPESLNDEEAWNIIIKSVNNIVEYAEKVGIKYAFEPIGFMLINDINNLQKLQDEIKTGKLYVNMDSSNVYITDDTIVDFLHHFKNDIIHIHVKDAIGKAGSCEFPPLGKGHLNFEEMFKALEEIDYQGYYSIEYVAFLFGYEEDIDTIREHSYQFVKQYI